jgi:hypothetical protein
MITAELFKDIDEVAARAYYTAIKMEGIIELLKDDVVVETREIMKPEPIPEPIPIEPAPTDPVVDEPNQIIEFIKEFLRWLAGIFK